MNTQIITKEFKITSTVDVMERLERFLGFLHYNGGHSGIFAIPFDGDGNDFLKVDPPPLKCPERKLISHVGQDIEVALNDCYKSYAIDTNESTYTAKDGGLIRHEPERPSIKVK